MHKRDVEKILKNNEIEKFRDIFKSKPQVVRKLMGFLYHPDIEIRNAAAKGIGIIAQVMPEEKLKDLLRRMLWMLNDESGSCCWHIPYAIGEIGYNNPDVIEDFIGCFSHYADDPDENLRTGVRDALKRIHETGRDFKHEGYIVFRKKNSKK